MRVRFPNGTNIQAEVLEKGAEGSWFGHSPVEPSFMYRLRIFEPSEDCLVQGLWLGVGRENELVKPVEAKTLNELMSQGYDPIWTDPRLSSRSLVTVRLTGTAEQVVVSFKNHPPRQVRL